MQVPGHTLQVIESLGESWGKSILFNTHTPALRLILKRIIELGTILRGQEAGPVLSFLSFSSSSVLPEELLIGC